MLKRIAKSVLPTWIWSKLQQHAFMRAYRQSMKNFIPRIVEHNYGGFPLKVHLSDPVSERWYDRDWEYPSEFAFCARGRLKAGARVFNIGAHQGVVAMMLARIVGPNGFVLAVEANPHNARVCEQNRILNNLQQLQVISAAAGEKSGELVINELLNGQVTSDKKFGAIQVPCVALDELYARFGLPQFVLLDVEGYECQVLSGAGKLLKARPDWCVEVHVGPELQAQGGSVDRVLSYFPHADYDLFMGEGADGSKQPKFIPFDRDHSMLGARFFLIAVSKAAQITGTGATADSLAITRSLSE